jgi:hypothetical protein
MGVSVGIGVGVLITITISVGVIVVRGASVLTILGVLVGVGVTRAAAGPQANIGTISSSRMTFPGEKIQFMTPKLSDQDSRRNYNMD